MRKEIKAWRMMQAEPFGLLMWFDPNTERPRLYELEPGDSEEGTLVVREDALCTDELRQIEMTFDQRENPHGSKA